MSASARPVRTWMSFRRIVDIPFGTCVAALDSGELTGHDGSRRRPGRGVRAGRAGPGLRDLPGAGPPAPRAAGPAATDAAAGRPLVLLPAADLFGTHPLRARPAQCRLLPGRPPAAGPVGPVAGPARAGAAPGLRRQPAIRRSGPTRAGQEPGPGSRPGSVPRLTLPGRRPGQAGGPAPAAQPSRTAQHQPTAGQEHDMARFMDFHEDLKLPAEARQHHAALGVPCGEVHQVDWLTWPGRIEESRPGSKE